MIRNCLSQQLLMLLLYNSTYKTEFLSIWKMYGRSSTIILGQLRRFIFQFIRRICLYTRDLISHFRAIASSFSDSAFLHMQKPCGINRRDERKILLSRASLRFRLRYLASGVFSCHTRVTYANYRRENQHPLRLLSRRVRIKIPLGHSLIFTLSLRLIRPVQSRNPEIRIFAQQECRSVWSKTKLWGKTFGRIFRTCKFTRERGELPFCVQAFITQTDNLLY